MVVATKAAMKSGFRLSFSVVVPRQDAALDEIRHGLLESLSRFGVDGRITVTGDTACLFDNARTVTVSLDGLPARWPSLDRAERQRQVSELGRQLADARRGRSPTPSSPRRLTLRDALAPFAILTAATLALVGAYSGYRRMLASSDGTTAADDTASLATSEGIDAFERERAARATRVCETTRSRVKRGAVVSPADVEGWVVELTLLRESGKGALIGSPVLTRYITPVPGQRRRELVWPEGNVLDAAEGPDTEVIVLDGSIPSAAAPDWHGVRLIFTGRYVVPFFHERQRSEYVRLAATLSELLAVDHAALYARCAHSTMHHLGAWFYGRDPGGAVTPLLYFMGMYADVPHLAESVRLVDGKLDRTAVFRRLSTATAALDKNKISHLLGPHGGMIAGPRAGPNAVTFPFHDSNRASRASRELARVLGIGTAR